MSVLDDDSPLMRLEALTGIHEDAVRCVFDERLNRLKRVCEDPVEQLKGISAVADDAMAFWNIVSALPEDRVGRRQSLANKLCLFFERAHRYADFHDDVDLTLDAIRIKSKMKQGADNKGLALLVYPEKTLGM